MAITASDLLTKLSINTGPGNSTVQANPNDSIGGFMSSSVITAASLNNLFDNVSGAENAAATVVDYRCLFFHNAHGSLSLTNSRLYITGETAGGVSVAIALDSTGITTATSASAQALRPVNETTAPAGPLTFVTTPISYATGLAPGAGTITNGQCFAVWIRRTSANSAALDPDGVVLRLEGDTLP
jgi:hypothetical protein